MLAGKARISAESRAASIALSCLYVNKSRVVFRTDRLGSSGAPGTRERRRPRASPEDSESRRKRDSITHGSFSRAERGAPSIKRGCARARARARSLTPRAATPDADMIVISTTSAGTRTIQWIIQRYGGEGGEGGRAAAQRRIQCTRTNFIPSPGNL